MRKLVERLFYAYYQKHAGERVMPAFAFRHIPYYTEEDLRKARRARRVRAFWVDGRKVLLVIDCADGSRHCFLADGSDVLGAVEELRWVNRSKGV